MNHDDVGKSRWIVMGLAIAYATALAACASLAGLTSGTSGSPHDAGPEAQADSATDAGTACDGQPVDLGTDPANCGRCGHGCMGGACAHGACQPFVVAKGMQGVEAIVLTTSKLYFDSYDNANTGAIFSCPLTGCGDAPTVLAKGLDGPWALAADESNIYFTSYFDGTVNSCPLDGCGTGTPPARLVQLWKAPPATPPSMSAPAPLGLAIDRTYVYFAFQWGPQAVYRCPIAGCGAAAPLMYAEGSMMHPWGLAIDTSNVYWDDFSGLVSMCPKTGCPGGGPSTLGSVGYGPGNIVQGGSSLYTVTGPALQGVDGGTDTVATIDIDSGINSVLTGADRPWMAAIDADYVYWTESGGDVDRCPIAGCSKPTVLAHVASGAPTAIAVNDRAIYWGNSPWPVYNATGTVMLLAK